MVKHCTSHKPLIIFARELSTSLGYQKPLIRAFRFRTENQEQHPTQQLGVQSSYSIESQNVHRTPSSHRTEKRENIVRLIFITLQKVKNY